MLDNTSMEEDYESHVISDNRKVLRGTNAGRSSSNENRAGVNGINENRRQS